MHRGYFRYNLKNPVVGVVTEDSEASAKEGWGRFRFHYKETTFWNDMLTRGQCQRSRDQPVKAQRSSVPFTRAVQLLADALLVVSVFRLSRFT